ncbi:MAG TPA: AraC family transcriptional regulator [Xanthobacteraceae bacterium]|nr:AraC family transcriptional regulator [Xanthobacteraceae bacterium]
MPFEVAKLDRIRSAAGYLTIAETLALADNGNVVLDPFSLLIGRGIHIGKNNVFFPNVSLSCEHAGSVTIGDGNTFFPGVSLLATHGPIVIGNGNQFGEGGFTAKANRSGAFIEIGDRGRYLGGAAVYGATELGSGSQILGAISADNCTLGPGAPHTDPNPDERGAVMKGAGTARDLTVARGMTLAGNGTFSAADAKPQSFYHK